MKCALATFGGPIMDIIERCRRDALPTILAIINDGAEAYRGVVPADRWHDPYMDAEALQAEIDAGVDFWGLERDGRLIGVMGLQQLKDVTLIRHAYVRTAERRAGVGSALIRRLLTLTDRQVLVGTWKAATWAITFYERHGFRLADAALARELLRKYWSIPDRQIETSVVLSLERT